MIIHHYHKATGEYLRSSEARIDPLETKKQGRDVYLLPAHATDIAPPKIGENEAPVFDGKAWNVVPDYRGAEYYLEDGQKVEISELGEAIPKDALLEPLPPPEPTEADLAEQKIQAEIRTMAIKRLISRGELPTNFLT